MWGPRLWDAGDDADPFDSVVAWVISLEHDVEIPEAW